MAAGNLLQSRGQSFQCVKASPGTKGYTTKQRSQHRHFVAFPTAFSYGLNCTRELKLHQKSHVKKIPEMPIKAKLYLIAIVKITSSFFKMPPRAGRGELRGGNSEGAKIL
jgi:hypothetical protein